jgi:hypothetical protein
MRLRFQLASALLLCLAAAMFAADRPDFSGSYHLTETRGYLKVKKGVVWTLAVTQTETSIGVTKVEDGHPTTNNYPLGGQRGIYVSSGGATGTCKAELKGKYLFLESLVTGRASPTAPPVQLPMKERWELSPDAKRLVIQVEIDNPALKAAGADSWSEIYTRD